MDERLHYPLRLRFSGAFIYVVWYNDERDGFVRDDAGRIQAAMTLDALMCTVDLRDELWGSREPFDYDFDQIRGWCNAPTSSDIDCNTFLNVWNFFDDLARLHEGGDSPCIRLSRSSASCYDKLFWGNNLPAVTPVGERFDPSWNEEEVAEIRSVFEAGLELLEAELRESGSCD